MWPFRKRAFSVSGRFRQLLHDLIRDMHNSNLKFRQVTLSGEILEENKFYILGFVHAGVVGLAKEVWFMQLTHEQIDSVEEFLSAQLH